MSSRTREGRAMRRQWLFFFFFFSSDLYACVVGLLWLSSPACVPVSWFHLSRYVFFFSACLHLLLACARVACGQRAAHLCVVQRDGWLCNQGRGVKDHTALLIVPVDTRAEGVGGSLDFHSCIFVADCPDRWGSIRGSDPLRCTTIRFDITRCRAICFCS